MDNSAAALIAPQLKRNPNAHDAYLEGIGKIFFYVYVSSAVRPFAPEELRDLLKKSRQANALLGVSGMLLYKEGTFLQVLEGGQTAVMGLVEKISRDPRHREITTLLEGFENEYQFPDWSMGFHHLDDAEARETPGFTDLLVAPFSPKAFAIDPTRAQRILLIFKQTV